MATPLLDRPDRSDPEACLHYTLFPEEYKSGPAYLSMPEEKVNDYAPRIIMESDNSKHCYESCLKSRKCTLAHCCCTVLKVLLVALVIIGIVIIALACAL